MNRSLISRMTAATLAAFAFTSAIGVASVASAAQPSASSDSVTFNEHYWEKVITPTGITSNIAWLRTTKGNSISKRSLGGPYGCSGAVVGGGRYLLTARHCIGPITSENGTPVEGQVVEVFIGDLSVSRLWENPNPDCIVPIGGIRTTSGTYDVREPETYVARDYALISLSDGNCHGLRKSRPSGLPITDRDVWQSTPLDTAVTLSGYPGGGFAGNAAFLYSLTNTLRDSCRHYMRFSTTCVGDEYATWDASGGEVFDSVQPIKREGESQWSQGASGGPAVVGGRIAGVNSWLTVGDIRPSFTDANSLNFVSVMDTAASINISQWKRDLVQTDGPKWMPEGISRGSIATAAIPYTESEVSGAGALYRFDWPTSDSGKAQLVYAEQRSSENPNQWHAVRFPSAVSSNDVQLAGLFESVGATGSKASELSYAVKEWPSILLPNAAQSRASGNTPDEFRFVASYADGSVAYSNPVEVDVDGDGESSLSVTVKKAVFTKLSDLGANSPKAWVVPVTISDTHSGRLAYTCAYDGRARQSLSSDKVPACYGFTTPSSAAPPSSITFYATDRDTGKTVGQKTVQVNNWTETTSMWVGLNDFTVPSDGQVALTGDMRESASYNPLFDVAFAKFRDEYPDSSAVTSTVMWFAPDSLNPDGTLKPGTHRINLPIFGSNGVRLLTSWTALGGASSEDDAVEEPEESSPQCDLSSDEIRAVGSRLMTQFTPPTTVVTAGQALDDIVLPSGSNDGEGQCVFAESTAGAVSWVDKAGFAPRNFTAGTSGQAVIVVFNKSLTNVKVSRVVVDDPTVPADDPRDVDGDGFIDAPEDESFIQIED